MAIFLQRAIAGALMLHLVQLGELLVFADVVLELGLFEQGYLPVDTRHQQVSDMLSLDEAL